MIVDSLSNGAVTIDISGESPSIVLNFNCPVFSGGGTSDHSQLENLDYENSGHTGFEPARGDDENYVTDNQLTEIGNIQNKVDKEPGKGLSENDYTTVEKEKLAGIEDGAQKNALNTVIDANYVHTDENFTATLKDKLDGIEPEATKGDSDAFHKSTPYEISTLETKGNLVDDDIFLIEDSEDNFNKKNVLLGKIKSLFAKLTGGNIFSGVQSMLDGVKVTKIYPNTDGIAAIQIMKADGTTAIMTIDTTNGRLGIGTTPGTYGLNVGGMIQASSIIRASNGLAEISGNYMTTYLNGAAQYGNINVGVNSAMALLSKNTEFLRGLPDQSISMRKNKPFFMDASPTVDTVNDVQIINVDGILTFKKCTGSSSTKNGGTWVTIGTF